VQRKGFKTNIRKGANEVFEHEFLVLLSEKKDIFAKERALTRDLEEHMESALTFLEENRYIISIYLFPRSLCLPFCLKFSSY
jgi:hypothetical protein